MSSFPALEKGNICPITGFLVHGPYQGEASDHISDAVARALLQTRCISHCRASPANNFHCMKQYEQYTSCWVPRTTCGLPQVSLFGKVLCTVVSIAAIPHAHTARFASFLSQKNNREPCQFVQGRPIRVRVYAVFFTWGVQKRRWYPDCFHHRHAVQGAGCRHEHQ